MKRAACLGLPLVAGLALGLAGCAGSPIDAGSAPVGRMTVTPSTSAVAPGDRIDLTAWPFDRDGGELTGRSVTWQSSDPAVAVVDGSGRVTVASDAAQGTRVTITATSEGVAGTAVIIVAPPPDAAFATWINCDPARPGVLVASRAADTPGELERKPWTLVSGANGVFRIPVGAFVSVAVTQQRGTGWFTSVYVVTGAEAIELGRRMCEQTHPVGTVNATVLNLPPQHYFSIVLGSAQAIQIPPATALSLADVTVGVPATLVGAAIDGTGPYKFFVRRIAVADGQTVPPFDVSGPGIAPEQHAFTVTNAGADTPHLSTAVAATSGSSSGVYFGTDLPVPAGFFRAIPSGALPQGTIQALSAVAFGGGGSSRSVHQFFTAPRDLQLALGPALAPVSISELPGEGYRRLAFVFTVQPEYGRSFVVNLSQGPRTLRLITSGAALNGASTAQLVTPALAALAAYAPMPGAPVDYSVVVRGFAGPGIVAPPPADGVVVRAAVKAGSWP
ncbi:MAG: Ig-like domain-containing protein [Gemmatimonadota bacterium]